MGTTLTALQAGSTRIAWTVLIEGYKYILTDGDTAAAVAAHSGSDHVGALGGLFVDLQNEQNLNPWEPFSAGGRCTLTIVPTSSSDTFGVDTALRDTGAETMLATTADRNDSIVVKSNANFPASGDAFVGTECFAYTSKPTSTTFGGVTRGKYEAFGSNEFAEHHRVGFLESSPKLEPIVTQYCRTWIGKWVGVYVHRVVDGVLDVQTQAQLVFAGRIDSIDDDAASGGTVVELRHVLDVIKEHTLGRELWSGRLGAGVYLVTGQQFSMNDYNGSSSIATPLSVVASGASGANQMNAGFYTHAELQTALNTWWASELQATRLRGTYAMTATQADGSVRTKIGWRIPTGGSVHFNLFMPQKVAEFLGYGSQFSYTQGIGVFAIVSRQEGGQSGVDNSLVANDPFKLIVFSFKGGTNIAEIVEERGTFVDNYATLPDAISPTSAGEWGVFLVNDSVLIYAKKNGDQLEDVGMVPLGMFGVEPYGGETTKYSIDAVDTTSVSSVPVRQILIMEQQFYRMLLQFFYSTGTSGYNNTTWDTLAYGLGLGIPAELLGADFISAAQHLPAAYAPIIVVIDKPTRFVDLFKGDLILRNSFLRWTNGRLDLCQWRTPLAGNASAALTEANKAAPSGTKEDHRTSARESSDWQRSIVRILYNRDITQMLSDDGYRSSLSLEDRVAIDDAGGEGRSVTIKCRNTYGQYANTGAGVEELAPGFLSIWPLFSKPMRLFSRSIDSTKFEGLAIGDCVTVSDGFARDPDTGTRGISNRPAIVVKHWYSFGGLMPTSDRPQDAAGGVDLMLLDSNRVKKYGPAAQVDDTANAGGFTAGYDSVNFKIRCYEHKYSESSEAADASWFAATYEVTVIEIDPVDPTAPQSWERAVSTVSGNDITLNAALTGFDTTKKYRVIFKFFSSAVDAQRAFAYQADDADGMIQDAAAPHQYGVGWPALTYTANSASDPIELPPNAVSDDGQSRDVAHDLALARLLENMHDYKLTVQAPQLLSTVATNVGTSPPTYRCVLIQPIYLTSAQLATSVRRELTVAPFFRAGAGAGGGSVNVRISLCRRPPSGDTFDEVVDRGQDYVEATWSTTSTTWATGAAAVLDIGSVKPGDGVCWLLLELGPQAESRGIARCSEGPRIFP